MRRTTGYILLDYRRNEDVLEELKTDPTENKLVQCKQKWLNLARRIEDIRYTKNSLIIDL